MNKWYRDKYLWISALAGFVMALLSLLPFLLSDGGFMALRDDFDYQQIYFNYICNEAVKNGGLGWSWSVDLGSDLITSMSFYTLGSPFFWLMCIFPAGAIPYLIGPVLALKYAVSCMGSYLYIRRFVKKGGSALIGALMYSFSGFTAQAVLFNHFHDVIALFPFLLLALEDKVTSKRRGLFALAIFINCLCNYYFFIGEAIFLVIYYLVRFGRREKAIFREIFSLVIEGVIGVCAAGVLFVPSVLAILNNPRASSRLDPASIGSWKFRLITYISIFKAFVLPSDIMSAQSCVIEHDYSSCAAYIPGVGISLAMAYFISHKGRLRVLISVCLAITLIPILGSMFLMFTEVQFRWLYMFVLLLSLASAKAIDEDLLKTKTARICIAVNIALVPIFILALRLLAHMGKLSQSAGDTGIIRQGPFCTRIALAILPLLILLFVSFKGSKKACGVTVLAAAIALGMLPLMINIREYRSGYDTKLRRDWFEASRELSKYEFDMNYRANNTRNYFCMAGGAHGLENFCSTITGSIYSMYETFDLERGPQVIDIFGIPGLKAYLGGRYLINDFAETDEIVYTFDSAGRTWYVTDEGGACPVAFTYDKAITPEELRDLPTEVRAIAAIRYLALPQEGLLEQVGTDELVSLRQQGADALDGAVLDANDRIAYITDVTDKGFTCANGEREGFLFVSCPYAPGWSASGDIGEAKELYQVNGFMAVSVMPGEKVTFTYETPGLKAGAVLSILGIVAILGLVLLPPQNNKTSLQFVNREPKGSIVE